MSKEKSLFKCIILNTNIINRTNVRAVQFVNDFHSQNWPHQRKFSKKQKTNVKRGKNDKNENEIILCIQN